MADRLCPCGAALEDVGPRRRCPACHGPADRWLVASCGRLVAVATLNEMFPAPELRGALRELLGPTWQR